MSAEPSSRGTSGSRQRHIMARILSAFVLLAIVLVSIGLAQGWFESNWLKAAAVVGIFLGVGGILRTVLSKEARGEMINLAALAIAFIPLIGGPVQDDAPPEPSTPRPVLSPVGDLLPYKIIGTGALGLLVRTCAVENCTCSGPDCNLLGTATENSVVWVRCSLDSGYVPPGEPNSIWYKIRWSNPSGGTRKFFDSKPGAAYSGWIFSRYAIAAGSSDTPPPC